MVPTTDYNTLYMYYKNLLMKYHSIDRNIDVSCLAKISVGIPLDFIRQAVEKVLSLRRRITLKFNPLSPIEIMEEILMYQHPTTEMMKNLDKFERRILLGRKRAKWHKCVCARAHVSQVFLNIKIYSYYNLYCCITI